MKKIDTSNWSNVVTAVPFRNISMAKYPGQKVFYAATRYDRYFILRHSPDISVINIYLLYN